MTARARSPLPPTTGQAWIELRANDPEAVSAAAVARAHLPAGQTLRSLRRMRVIELTGVLPGREGLEALLHRSIQFYNPHKERCTVRASADDPAPVAPDEVAVLVVDRGGDRRGAAEHWWQHQAGGEVEVREGVAWLVAFDTAPGSVHDARVLAESLAVVRERRIGLLCNPHAQDFDIVEGVFPLPWIRTVVGGRDATGGDVGGGKAAAGVKARARR